MGLDGASWASQFWLLKAGPTGGDKGPAGLPAQGTEDQTKAKKAVGLFHTSLLTLMSWRQPQEEAGA